MTNGCPILFRKSQVYYKDKTKLIKHIYSFNNKVTKSRDYCLATSPVDRTSDKFHLNHSHQLRLVQVIRSNHFVRSPSINILILLWLNLLCQTAWGHFILVPIRHWRFTGRKRVAGTRTQNAAVLGFTGLVAKKWRTAGKSSIYLIIKDNYYGWTISSSSSKQRFKI